MYVFTSLQVPICITPTPNKYPIFREDFHGGLSWKRSLLENTLVLLPVQRS